jgi:hypothetical protein
MRKQMSGKSIFWESILLKFEGRYICFSLFFLDHATKSPNVRETRQTLATRPRRPTEQPVSSRCLTFPIRWKVRCQVLVKSSAYLEVRAPSCFICFNRARSEHNTDRSSLTLVFLRQEPEVRTGWRSMYYTPRVTCLQFQDSLILRNPRNKQGDKLSR